MRISFLKRKVMRKRKEVRKKEEELLILLSLRQTRLPRAGRQTRSLCVRCRQGGTSTSTPTTNTICVLVPLIGLPPALCRLLYSASVFKRAVAAIAAAPVLPIVTVRVQAPAVCIIDACRHQTAVVLCLGEHRWCSLPEPAQAEGEYGERQARLFTF